jgi:hypothetical protein
MKGFAHHQMHVIKQLLLALINQEKAEIIVTPEKPESGFWFGGGKLAMDLDGTIWLSGRYRNAGDSRTGLEAGVRGAECAVFRSSDGGIWFTKACSWTKADLSSEGQEVISIEGTALHRRTDQHWDLYISTERNMPYPDEVAHYQKPGTGVWRIDRLVGSSPDSFDLQSIHPILQNLDKPAYLHIKDPVVYSDSTGNTILIFCSHPYSWSSDNTGYALRKAGARSFSVQEWEMVSRGATWDVAVTRVTGRLHIPRIGIFSDIEPISVYFYDGAECMRNHQENIRAHKRPRGYSCEELGGAFIGWMGAFPKMRRLSLLEPLFVSSNGTGSSRYVDSLVTSQGILAVWQQAQEDGSQPLVRNFLPMDQVEKILAGE